MFRDEFRHRRAKSGFGPRRLELLQKLWHADNDITHYIILGDAAGHDGPAKLERARADRARIEQELKEITHEAR